MFHDQIVLAADQKQMFDLIATHEHELSLLVDTRNIEDRKARSAALRAHTARAGKESLRQPYHDEGEQDHDRSRDENRHDRSQTFADKSGDPFTH